MNEYLLLFLITYALVVYSLKFTANLVRATRFYEWKFERDKLTLEQFKQRLEIDYYKANMEDLYNEK